MSWNTKRLTIFGIMLAMTTVATMVIQIPMPATRGYLNLGDAVLLTTALLFGRRAGAVAGGVGSMMADVLLGYVHYAPVTLVVKGLEGFICGVLFEHKRTSPLVAALLAGCLMALGYFTYEAILYGLVVALGSLALNLGQGILGAIIAYLLYRALPLEKLMDE